MRLDDALLDFGRYLVGLDDAFPDFGRCLMRLDDVLLPFWEMFGGIG